MDRLLEFGVIRRGLVLRCARCNWAAFDRLDAVGRTFDCSRCDHARTLDRRAWKAPVNEPLWFYDLDQALRAALLADAAVPIIALAELQGRHRSFSLDLGTRGRGDRNQQPVAEIDLWAIADGQVMVGEAKSTPHLSLRKKEKTEIVRKVLDVAAAVDADIVCFATSASAWDASDAALIRQAVDQTGRELRLLEGLGWGTERPGS